MKRIDKARVSCTECGFEWFGETAAHALRTVGACTRCRGELHFGEEIAPSDGFASLVDVPAHLVLGNPRH